MCFFCQFNSPNFSVDIKTASATTPTNLLSFYRALEEFYKERAIRLEDNLGSTTSFKRNLKTTLQEHLRMGPYGLMAGLWLS